MSILSPALAAFLAASFPHPAAMQAAQTTGEVDVVQGRADLERRLTVPVRIGEHGPFRFVIDTGSQTTVVASDIATRLALAPGSRARVIGMAGIEQVETARLDDFNLGRRSIDGLRVPLLEGQHIGADGIVGIDSLQEQRVLLDFDRNQMAVGDRKTLGGNSGYEIVVTARRRSGQLIITNAEIDGVNTQVVIDTGSNISVGNRALQQALRQRANGQRVQLISVTGQQLSADLGHADRLSIGSADITNLIVAYADTPVFGFLDLEKRPALMLGMRELRLFKRIAIDFGTRRVYFDLPKGS